MRQAIESACSSLPIYRSPEDVVLRLNPSCPVYCVRSARIQKAARRFLDGFRGDVLYAVKCNAEPHMLRELYTAGIRHFDTASLPEIELVSGLFEEASAYFMHPVKSRRAISLAYKTHSVRHYVVDHLSELQKISEQVPSRSDIVIVVRIAVNHTSATFELSSKFGASVERAIQLVRESLQHGFNYGIAFHVGSQCLDPNGYRLGIELIRQMLVELDDAPLCIDVGGGFPATYENSSGPDLAGYLTVINDEITSLNLPNSCRLLCEPGRAIVADGESLVAQIQLRKGNSLYLNDGMYGSMIEEKYGLRLPVRMIASRRFSENLVSYLAYGPTCDALDVYPAPLELPSDIQEGDWIEFGCIGAYGNACRTRFNGFYPDTFVMVENDFGEID